MFFHLLQKFVIKRKRVMKEIKNSKVDVDFKSVQHSLPNKCELFFQEIQQFCVN